ncbi:uncharacterized protein [Arachis hypogaea]|uniref:uncharacterized protein isoform X2 n=1 Tax=Arachis hypogaea TaxID=3818 RepID=UPI000DED61EC|nr:uncharacterized protein LOC112786015 isoform X2 [Arachis hypogaea]QHN82340.1 uncharacterized protein DS421_20g694970 [Arachis hypogaea]
MTAGLPPQGARATIVVILVNCSVAVQPRPATSPWSPLLRARHLEKLPSRLVPLSPPLPWSSPAVVVEGPAERENERGSGSPPRRGAMLHAAVATSPQPPLRGFRHRHSSVPVRALRSRRRRRAVASPDIIAGGPNGEASQFCFCLWFLESEKTQSPLLELLLLAWPCSGSTLNCYCCCLADAEAFHHHWSCPKTLLLLLRLFIKESEIMLLPFIGDAKLLLLLL